MDKVKFIREISRETDYKKLEVLLTVESILDENGLVEILHRRTAELIGLDYSNSVERGYYNMLRAYEALKTLDRKSGNKAGRTRQMLSTKGCIQTIIDLTMGEMSEGFKTLVKYGYPKFTVEYIVFKNQDVFESDVIDAAIKRLNEKAGLKLEKKSK